ncbi:ArsR/SmtB family transcription factor [Parvibium lacunae]|uniref:ArsR family transcriptional regulator n=1 Tax=Parvibium lacunae TaxID=1888893 RepID=A0A368L3G1_9BURK|nr:helix-turn-helix domain-containing protein [Parvibium lacunae]RCS58117.1 ArsR family transcriptional regulator [Parvibium lacunae]
MNDAAAVTALSALAQHHRLAIFRLLVVAGQNGMLAGELAKAVDCAPSALSFHAKTLLQAGLIQQDIQGRHVRYQVALAHMQSLLTYLTENCCGGSSCDAAVPSVCCPTPEKT